MRHYSIRNIYIDYDGIQCECYLSRNRIKRVVYNFIYGQINTPILDYLEEHDLKVGVYWDYKRLQPVIHIPQAKGYPAVIHELGKDLGWFSKSLERRRYE